MFKEKELCSLLELMEQFSLGSLIRYLLPKYLKIKVIDRQKINSSQVELKIVPKKVLKARKKKKWSIVIILQRKPRGLFLNIPLLLAL
jgi:hypothetical protein